jgi:flagellar motor protein MotB
MQISVQGWKASPSEWEAVRKLPKDQLPPLTEEQREVARKLGVSKEDYARSALAGERTQNALLEKTETFARLLERKLRELGSNATVENVVLQILDDRFEVLLRVNGKLLPLRIKEDVIDDLFESGSAEAEQKLARILDATVGVRERQ